ncbi:ABC transporter ATP-binding protein [Paenibacillus sp.]|jgi:energy-coupling factor transport system ATP-binding protein|uniref:ABC transporter ATP-binding protein n=1 Tax=Paenibacillus sp. TaxID=58172 RepID=UPI00283813CB|nr:ABC transporter ATP-binding protein [Paenibacillus sp.]MDR0267016.1 energy-coupling factor ABC transporter ATP-binding protein [Paenibacillus sp.]
MIENNGVTQDQVAAEVKMLRLKFPGENSFVFKDLSLSIRRGEKILLLGPSGCGKSTLLQVLGGLIPHVIEVPLKAEKIQVPESKGYVFQDPDTQFCMPYVDEELAFVLENRRVKREQMHPWMKKALVSVGLDLAELHVPVDSLSQGMKQRLALASVLLLEPEVIFLDEPSALLDPEGRQQMWEAVWDAAEGRTLIVVEHRIEEIADRMDRIILFAPDGSVIGDGSPERIFRTFRRELQQYGIWYPGVWEDFFRIVETHREEAAKPPGRGNSAPLMALREYTVYRTDRPLVHVEAAEVYPGDFIAVTGPNGAGKSSLLLSLMGLLRFRGEYVLCGGKMPETVGERRSRSRKMRPPSNRIGYVFQNPEFQFVAETVLDEVSFSLKTTGLGSEQTEEKARGYLHSFHLTGMEHRHPYQLSTGQKRRLSMAAAVICGQPILLLDEPTFGQDARNTFAILDYCMAMQMQGAAIVMVTHEEEIVRHTATRIWEVLDGAVKERLPARRAEMRVGT